MTVSIKIRDSSYNPRTPPGQTERHWCKRRTTSPSCNTGNACTSLAPAVEVVNRRAGERLARLRYVHELGPLLGLLERPPLAARSTSNSSKNTIARASMPGHDVVDRRILDARSKIGGTTDGSAAVTKERVDLGHHSSPQQIAHLPLRWFGLHLSPCSPWMRPLSGAVCCASRPMDRCIARRTAVCTHRERFPLVVFSAKKSRYSAAWLVRLTVMMVFLSLITPSDATVHNK